MSFAIYIVYLVMTFIRPDAFAQTLAEYRPMAVLMGLALPLALIAQYRYRRNVVRPAAYAALGMIVVAIALSQVANHWLGGAIVAGAAFLPSAAIGLLTMLNLSTEQRLRLAAGLVVLCVTGLTALSTYSFYTGFDAQQFVLQEFADTSTQHAPIQGPFVPADAHDPGTLFRIRSVGFLEDPNDFAQLIVVALILAWAGRRKRHAMRNLARVYVPCAVLLFGLYLTHSRGALVGLGLAVLLTAARKLGLLRTGALLGLFAAAAAVTNFTGGRAISDQDASAANRIDFWNLGLHLLAKHPLFGVGYGNFSSYNQLTAHNSFVLCFSELGLLGFFFWMAFIVLAYQSVGSAVAQTQATSSQHRLALGLRAALIGFLGCAWFLSRTYEPGLYIVCGLCLASSGCLAEPVRDRPWVKATAWSAAFVLVAVYGFVILQRVLGH